MVWIASGGRVEESVSGHEETTNSKDGTPPAVVMENNNSNLTVGFTFRF